MSKVNESIVNQKLKYIQREVEKNSSTLVLRFKADKAYLYNNGVAVAKAEKINLKDIKFKKGLKKMMNMYVKAYKS